jgi:hypothetical protein
MRKLSCILTLTFVFAFIATGVMAADTFIFQFGLKGYDATKDTHITEYSGNSTNNMGGNIENECCEYNPANTDGKSYLIWFNVSSIPKGAILGKATLELYMTSTRNGTSKKTVAAHRLLKDWAEGTGAGIDGVAAKKDEVCGQWTGKGEDWSKAGADEPDEDYVATADDSIEIEGKTSEWYAWNVTKMCQYWVNNPNNNFGAILLEPRPHAATLGTKVFASKENTNKDIYPKLTVMVTSLSIVDSHNCLATSWGNIKSGI